MDKVPNAFFTHYASRHLPRNLKVGPVVQKRAHVQLFDLSQYNPWSRKSDIVEDKFQDQSASLKILRHSLPSKRVEITVERGAGIHPDEVL